MVRGATPAFRRRIKVLAFQPGRGESQSYPSASVADNLHRQSGEATATGPRPSRLSPGLARTQARAPDFFQRYGTLRCDCPAVRFRGIASSICGTWREFFVVAGQVGVLHAKQVGEVGVVPTGKLSSGLDSRLCQFVCLEQVQRQVSEWPCSLVNCPCVGGTRPREMPHQAPSEGCSQFASDVGPRLRRALRRHRVGC
jgi:hypothetical protein